MEIIPINKQFDFNTVKYLQCNCGATVSYSMMTIMSMFDVDYIECPSCNKSHVIDIGEFKINNDE